MFSPQNSPVPPMPPSSQNAHLVTALAHLVAALAHLLVRALPQRSSL
jgi:hypothetical protein